MRRYLRPVTRLHDRAVRFVGVRGLGPLFGYMAQLAHERSFIVTTADAARRRFCHTVVQIDGDVLTLIPPDVLQDRELLARHSEATAQALAEVRAGWESLGGAATLYSRRARRILAGLSIVTVGAGGTSVVSATSLFSSLLSVTFWPCAASFVLSAAGWAAGWAIHRRISRTIAPLLQDLR